MKNRFLFFFRPARQLALFLAVFSAAMFLFAPHPLAAEKFKTASIDDIGTLIESHEGEIVLLNIFASWCPPCAQEANNFVRFYHDNPPSSGVHLYGISLDDNKSDLSAFIDRKKLNFPVYNCGQDFVDFFEIQSIPTLIVIDRAGSLVEYRIGVASLKELNQIVEKYK
ncbi:MAG: TlpA family protein disulfide reductase [Desulfovibrionaceae bacterium]|nr:TlpA family protein disulfide reductase [Desulfovibrionaceae bacterium]